ncbi:hypothetical protein D9757_000143 [Collybiopsis confluens]|uniref:Ribosomal RNA-processing protein 8 n=1 Tax=Collybiopsis confluens TaxID=2823264 RepID=A0A8H5I2I3_9AGAR|nr:hypothetical protein D9757_000143 [Collybiopsis confluens]
MPLFNVPGWSIPTEPVTEPGSRKRKRPANDTGSEIRIASTEVNLEKLVQKLTGKRDSNNSKNSKKLRRQQKEEQQSRSSLDDDDKKKTISLPIPLMSAKERAAKKARPTHSDRSLTSQLTPAKHPEKNEDEDVSLTSMQKGMKQKLEGARFRLLNQSLYESSSEDALKMMQDDPTVYLDYHSGFRQQVQSWPSNPVDHYIASLSLYPDKTVVADLGCGDAALAQALIPKGFSVLSFDLVSNNPYVVAVDICGTLPLPGSEGAGKSTSDGEAHIVDVVVFSLSLMSKNWPQSIREAWRILKSRGDLKIAEVTSRFVDVDAFVSLISSMGFKLKSKVC